MMLKEMMEIEGHEVQVANDGMSALERAKAFLPDLALLDIGMPVMNGYELAKALQRVPQLHATRLAVITGWGAKEDRDRTKEAGFHHHLTKPVNFEALKNILSNIGWLAQERIEKVQRN